MSADDYALPNTVLRHFDLASASYRDASDIGARRKASPDGRLFFDRLLAFADIDGECGIAHHNSAAGDGVRQ
jgi:hypothetical protein